MPDYRDCRNCQWCWLSEEGDKYNEPDYMLCDNGFSDNCGRVVGKIDKPYEIECEDYEEPL